MNEEFSLAAKLGAEKYKKVTLKDIRYGTSGFREKALELTHVMYRMGLLATLRSKAKNGSTIGVMITASHNPEEDNGVKLCDPDGKMLDFQWEEFATTLVNVSDANLSQTLTNIVSSAGIDYGTEATVFVARDTRSSSPFLSSAALDGVTVLSGKVKDFGVMTTPQLHFVVYCMNRSSYGSPTPEGYYEKLSSAFESLTADIGVTNKTYIPTVYVDGANGVGALKLIELKEYISSLVLDIFNDGSSGKLNYKCGADFLKINQKPPEGGEFVSGRRYASVDGDADRLVYYYRDDNGDFRLLDGDKIAALVAGFLKDLVRRSGLSLDTRVVQTAYANGSSTSYIQNELGIPVVCVPTGVKYLHHEAMKYDMGVYFEANGHGTVVFSEGAKSKVQELALNSNIDESRKLAAGKLLCTIALINESVGDAISDLLLTEVILRDRDWDLKEWDSLYRDLPNRQLKVTVPDRHAISTTDAERKCVQPEGLQEAINDIISKYRNARSFVRPSGTEDVVRVYAEADTQEDADALAEEVSLAVKTFTRV